MPDGGKITISSKAEGDCVKISIKDEGGGISQADLAKLGEPFFSTKEEGTGLGLTICLNIIGAHNGEMKIDSNWAREAHSTFCFRSIKVRRPKRTTFSKDAAAAQL